jgi:RNA recognition motif-containing protein
MSALVQRVEKKMNNKLFVGNLPYTLTDADLEQLFAQYGEVTSCKAAKDRDTGRPRGFAFVEMTSQSEAEAAIKGLNGTQVGGRQISVAVSEPKPRATAGSGGGFNRNRY